MDRNAVRVYLLPIVIAAGAAVPAIGGWVEVPSGTTADLNDLAVFNASVLFLGGDGGTLLHSTNSGQTWSTVPSGTTEDLVSVDVHTSTQWWAGGTNGTVLVSTNAGASWVPRPAPTSSPVHLFSRSSTVSWAVGEGGLILKSTNLGVDWTEQSSGSMAYLQDGDGFSNGPAHVVGEGGTILSSPNGLDWSPVSSGVGADLHCYIEGAFRMAVGDGGTVLKSTDGGITWLQKTSGTTADLYHVRTSEVSASRVVACGAHGTVIKSTDAGDTWCVLSTGLDVDLHAVWQINAQTILVFGEGGVILRTDDGGGTCLTPAGVEDEPEPTSDPETGAAACTVSPVAPNPSRSWAQLSLRVRDPQWIRARVFDISGRSGTVVFNGHVSPGEEQIIAFRTESLPSGVYVVSVEGPSVAARQLLRIVR